MSTNEPHVSFYAFSAAVTGFSEYDLRGTGVGQAYWHTLTENTNPPTLDALFLQWQEIQAESDGHQERLDKLLRTKIFANETLGPIARVITKMWYSGNWYPLDGSDSFVIGAQTYVEGLVWRAFNSHPMGAKQPGYGTWNNPPESVI